LPAFAMAAGLAAGTTAVEVGAPASDTGALAVKSDCAEDRCTGTLASGTKRAPEWRLYLALRRWRPGVTGRRAVAVERFDRRALVLVRAAVVLLRDGREVAFTECRAR
jgi:hypothetical protein